LAARGATGQGRGIHPWNNKANQARNPKKNVHMLTTLVRVGEHSRVLFTCGGFKAVELGAGAAPLLSAASAPPVVAPAPPSTTPAVHILIDFGLNSTSTEAAI